MKDDGIQLRPGTLADAERCAAICFEAFRGINARHGFPSDFARPQIAQGLMQMLFSNSHAFNIVAEKDGRIIGSNFLWDGAIGAIGPITVDESVQEHGAGRMMMQWAIDRAAERRMAGVRLVQAGFNMRSLSLYTKLGFDVREPLACMTGKPINRKIAGRTVRKMTEADIDACCDLCMRVHGHDRRGELGFAFSQGTGRIVESDGRITGYASDVGFFGHAVALENSDLKALLAAAEQFSGPGFLLPSRNGEVFRWCLENGLRIVQPMNLMSRGLYNEPMGAFLPSILF